MIYCLKVISGNGRGKKIGFPTFNLNIPQPFSLKQGVYAARVWINGDEFKGALFFGPTLTFSESDLTLEVFVLDYQSNEDIEYLKFETLKYLRPVKKFASAEELSAQIKKDVKDINKMANGQS